MSATSQLFILLGVLLVLSAFFSGTETALMRLSPYRVRSLARKGHLGARLAEKLLARPDRLIGLILAGNNAVNVAASAITTIIALRMGGESAVWVGGAILLLVVLIFAELAPKTVAALYPEKIALRAALIYYPLLSVFYPAIWLVNMIANGLLRLIGIRISGDSLAALSHDELHAAVSSSGTVLPTRRRAMLLRILELETVTVEDIMVPRSDVARIDLDDDWDDIIGQIQGAQHTRLPVCRDGLDNVIGVLHLRSVVKKLITGKLDKDGLREAVLPVYFVPEDTPLNKQLVNFKTARERMGLVVDEYGELQGLVTIDDLLEEIVGEYTTDPLPVHEAVDQQDDGSFIVNGRANIRALNRSMRWHLPEDGAKTINGLILEIMETIPESGSHLEISGYPITVLQTSESAVQTARIGQRSKLSAVEALD